jgi:hypothetical protein
MKLRLSIFWTLMSLGGAGLMAGGWILSQHDQHDVSLRCASAPLEPLRFELRTNHVNSVSEVFFWSDSRNEPLWAFLVASRPINPKDLPSITYGVIPNVDDRLNGAAVQVFPISGSPRSIAPGERFSVLIPYQYDSVFPPAPCMGHKLFLFEVQQNLSITSLGVGKLPIPRTLEQAYNAIFSAHGTERGATSR